MIFLCTGRGLCPAPYKNGVRLPAGFDFKRRRDPWSNKQAEIFREIRDRVTRQAQ